MSSFMAGIKLYGFGYWVDCRLRSRLVRVCCYFFTLSELWIKIGYKIRTNPQIFTESLRPLTASIMKIHRSSSWSRTVSIYHRLFHVHNSFLVSSPSIESVGCIESELVFISFNFKFIISPSPRRMRWLNPSPTYFGCWYSHSFQINLLDLVLAFSAWYLVVLLIQKSGFTFVFLLACKRRAMTTNVNLKPETCKPLCSNFCTEPSNQSKSSTQKKIWIFADSRHRDRSFYSFFLSSPFTLEKPARHRSEIIFFDSLKAMYILLNLCWTENKLGGRLTDGEERLEQAALSAGTVWFVIILEKEINTFVWFLKKKWLFFSLSGTPVLNLISVTARQPGKPSALSWWAREASESLTKPTETRRINHWLVLDGGSE